MGLEASPEAVEVVVAVPPTALTRVLVAQVAQAFAVSTLGKR